VYGTTANARYNPYYNPDGYLYAVDVPTAGATVTVQLFDAPCAQTGVARDSVTGSCTSQVEGTEFLMYDYSGSSFQYNAESAQEPNNVLDDSVGNKCKRVYLPSTLSANGAGVWSNLCTFVASSPGIYPLRVRNDNITGECDTPDPVEYTANTCVGTGINNYAIRATSTIGTPKVYALDNMSIYTGYSGSTANFYLAQIDGRYNGRELAVDLYDPGDGNDTALYTMKLLGPGGVAWPCKYWDSVGQLDTSASPTTSPTCSIVTHTTSNTSPYNGRWLHFKVVLTNYTCTTDCWWKINYVFGAGSAPTDRTVWAIRILGDPVHLVS
jgi:hypothetical protein